MSTIELKPPATAGMRAYAAWHGMTIEHVQDEWAEVPQADRMRAKWEAAGAAVEAADRDSRGMFVARLENMQKNGDTWLTVQAVLALLNDCDMLAAHQTVDVLHGWPDRAPSVSTEQPRCTCLTSQLGPDYCEVHAA